MCGENRSPRAAKGKIRGSPPRVRGKHRGIEKARICAGITPACAGKTLLPRLPSQFSRDHPRVCGENRYSSDRVTLFRGSPPRVRGKLRAHNSRAHAVRITPACAGKTYLWKHPSALHRGSPPRVRGKLITAAAAASSLGITPACAGKTPQNWFRWYI